MRKSIMLALVAAAGCAGARSTPPSAHPPPIAVDVELTGGAIPEVIQDQSPETKLQLGHYWSPHFHIGLIIDRTGEQAKVRFDGTRQTLTLTPQYFWFRTEYHRAPNDKLLVVSNTGRITLHVEGAGEDGIWLHRDGDAAPL
jgi:hypothetical protein